MKKKNQTKTSIFGEFWEYFLKKEADESEE